VKDRILVTSETKPSYVVGPEGLAEAFRVFWKIKGRYDYAKRGIWLELFWCIIVWFVPFSTKIGPFTGDHLRYTLAAFWFGMLLWSAKSIYTYRSKYKGDETEMFLEELRKQPWR